MNFYRLTDDVHHQGRWYLGDVSNFNSWSLLNKAPQGIDLLDMDVFRDGEELDFTLSECYGLPVVSDKIKEALDGVSGIQFISLEINGKSCISRYHLLVVSTVLKCVDECRSMFNKFEINDPVRPDKAGHYRGFMKLIIDAEKAKGHQLFRLEGFEIALIISEEIKARLDNIQAKGVRYLQV
jgi:hypothetical protein